MVRLIKYFFAPLFTCTYVCTSMCMYVQNVYFINYFICMLILYSIHQEAFFLSRMGEGRLGAWGEGFLYIFLLEV